MAFSRWLSLSPKCTDFPISLFLCSFSSSKVEAWERTEKFIISKQEQALEFSYLPSSVSFLNPVSWDSWASMPDDFHLWLVNKWSVLHSQRPVTFPWVGPLVLRSPGSGSAESCYHSVRFIPTVVVKSFCLVLDRLCFYLSRDFEY